MAHFFMRTSLAAVHLTNYIFDGARAELAKALSLSPAFNVTHSFNMGAQGGAMGGINPGTYSFGGMYATNNVNTQITRIPPPP
jgi:mitochondrial import receptor subunit TOM40